MSDATIIAASLNSAELERSIKALVDSVKRGMDEIKTSVHSTVADMQKTLQGLGSIRVDTGGASDGGSSRRTKVLREEMQVVNQVTASYDNLNNSIKKASGENSLSKNEQQTRQNTQAVKEEANTYDLLVEKIKNAATQAAKRYSVSDIQQMRMHQHELEAQINKAISVQSNNPAYQRALQETSDYFNKLSQQRAELESKPMLRPDEENRLRMVVSEWERVNEIMKQLSRGESAGFNINNDQTARLQQLRSEYEQVQAKIRDMGASLNEAAWQQANMATAAEKSKGAIEEEVKSSEKLVNSQKLVEEIRSKRDATKAFEKISLMPQNTLEEVINKGRLLQQLIAKVKDTPLMSQSNTKLAEKQLEKIVSLYRYLQTEKEKAAKSGTSAEEKQTQQLTQQAAAVEKVKMTEEERTRAMVQMGEKAQEEAQKIFSSIQAQMSAANYTQPIEGLKELQHALREMQHAQKGGGTTAFDADIKKARELVQILQRYNFLVAGMGSIGSNAPKDTFNEYSSEIQKLVTIYHNLSEAEREAAGGKGLLEKLQQYQQKVREIQQQQNRPVSLNAALGLDENTIDRISYKIQQLSSYKSGLDINDKKSVEEMETVEREIDRLKKKLNELMGENAKLEKSNNALARSWNYMKNRLAFYFTVGASTQFVKQLAEIRGQYEMTEKALGVLVDSAQKGSQIFNELSQMALISPYTLIELSNAARQMTAYGTAAKDVVDVTRRVADMAAAVGAPIERLTYALGHVQTYTYLTSLQARQFINAGIPITKELANLYTEMEGRMVSVADVYDRMKKKAVSYNDVMQVVNRMTDEGGRFFDFQAKMADTLKVQIANLNLAWNNMLNDIGKSTQGPIVGAIKGLKALFLRWKDINNAISSLGIAFGVVKVAQILYIAYTQKVGVATAAADVASKKMVATLYTMKGAFTSLMTSPLTWWTVLVSAVISAGIAFYNANERVKEFNQSLRDSAKENKKNIENFISTNDIATKVVSNMTGQDELEKMWVSIREQIELTSASSEELVNRLLSINDIRVRVESGLGLLNEIKAVNAALEEMEEKAITITSELSGWWNLWILPDGLIQNLKEYQDSLEEESKGFWETFSLNLGNQGVGIGLNEELKDSDERLNDLREDLQKLTNSIINFIELKGWSGDEAKITEIFNKVREKIVEQGQLDPQQAYTLQLLLEEARSEAAKSAQAKRLNDLNAAYKAETDEEVKYSILAEWNKQKEIYDNWESYNGRSKVEWERFTKWLKEQHIAETTAMFRNMDSEQIKSLNFQSGEYGDFVNRMVTKYAKEHKMSYDEAFNYLRTWITSANQWSIFIPLIIGTQEKSVEQQLGEYDATIDKADATIKRLTTRIDELREKQKLTYEEQKELDKAEKERADAEKAKAEAESKGGHGKQEAKDAKEAGEDLARAQRQAESELQKALKEELSLIDKVRSTYKTLTKEGVGSTRALTESTSGYNETVAAINKTFAKFGLARLDLTKYAGVQNPREIMNMLQSQLNSLVGRAKPAEIKELQTKIKDLNVDSITFDQKKLVESMNNSLGKIKDEYELAVELDADPELGSMFTQMFGIDVDTLPKTFGEAFDRANEVAKDKLKELQIDIENFDLLSTSITPDENKQWMGLDFESEPVKELVKWQNTWRDIFKKNVTDTEKMLDDYVKKYGDYSDKIAQIESERLEKISKLNNKYRNEEERNSLDYMSKLTAINNGAEREKSNAWFEEFKNSRYYTMMFENLDYISTRTIRDMRDELRKLMNDMNQLTPEQLKQVISQYEKLEEKLAKRRPFGSLGRKLGEYFSTMSDRKAAEKQFSRSQHEYEDQLEVVTALKEKKELLEHNHQIGTEEYEALLWELHYHQAILESEKDEVDAAEKKLNTYNLIKKEAQQQAAITAQMVATNLQSMGELRDLMQDTWGIELGEDINGMVDGMVATGEGINKIVSSATSGDVVGVVVGVGKAVTGVADAFGSIFGGGMKDTYTPFIETMQSVVDALDRINDRLLNTLSKMNGARALEYYDKILANDKRIEQQYREAAERYGESGSSWKSHSHNYNTNERLMDDLEDISRVAGQEINAIQDFYTLSAKQLEDIMLGLPNVWMEIDEEQRQWFEKIIEMQDEAEEHAKGLSQALTGIDIDSLSSDFESLISDITKTFEDAGDNVTEILRNAVIRGLMVKTYSAELEEWQKTFEDYMSDGVLSPKEAEYLKNWYLDISKRAMGDRDAALGALGLEDNKEELSNLQQGIQGITEETAGALEAITNGISQQCYLQSGLLTQIRDAVVGFDMDVQLGVVSQILLQLQSSYQVQMSIQSILSGWSNPSGLAVRVEMV